MIKDNLLDGLSPFKYAPKPVLMCSQCHLNMAGDLIRSEISRGFSLYTVFSTVFLKIFLYLRRNYARESKKGGFFKNSSPCQNGFLTYYKPNICFRNQNGNSLQDCAWERQHTSNWNHTRSSSRCMLFLWQNLTHIIHFACLRKGLLMCPLVRLHEDFLTEWELISVTLSVVV